MKITPNNALFTAISQFPDPSQVRARQTRAAAQQPAGRADDPRAALIRDALRQAAQRQAQEAGQGQRQVADQKKSFSAKAAAKSPELEAAAAADISLQTYAAGSVRREAPLAEARPTFVRLGQFIDLKI